MMLLRENLRGVALLIPRVRRFYEYAQLLQARSGELQTANDTLNATIEMLIRERDELARAFEGARRELETALSDKKRAEAETLAAKQKQEDTELKLYVLRSDYHRAVSASERLRASLQPSKAVSGDARQDHP